MTRHHLRRLFTRRPKPTTPGTLSAADLRTIRTHLITATTDAARDNRWAEHEALLQLLERISQALQPEQPMSGAVDPIGGHSVTSRPCRSRRAVRPRRPGRSC